MTRRTTKGCPHMTDADYIARLMSKIRVAESGCWEWTGFQKPLRGMPHLKVGYGAMRLPNYAKAQIEALFEWLRRSR